MNQRLLPLLAPLILCALCSITSAFDYTLIDKLIEQKDKLDPLFSDSSPSHGVTITKVYPGSHADKIGLKTGDVIISINDSDVGSADLINEQRKLLPSNIIVYRDKKHIPIKTGSGLLGIDVQDFDNFRNTYIPHLSNIETSTQYIFLSLLKDNYANARDFIQDIPLKYSIRIELKEDLNALYSLYCGKHKEIKQEVITRNVKFRTNPFIHAIGNSHIIWGEYKEAKRLSIQYPHISILHGAMDENSFDTFRIDHEKAESTSTCSNPIKLITYGNPYPGNLSDGDIHAILSACEMPFSIPSDHYIDQMFGPGGKRFYLIKATVAVSETDPLESEFEKAIKIGFLEDYPNRKDPMAQYSFALPSNGLAKIRRNHDIISAIGHYIPFNPKQKIEISFMLGDNQWSASINESLVGQGFINTMNKNYCLFPYFHICGLTGKISNLSVYTK
jgi:hypothetical protein